MSVEMVINRQTVLGVFVCVVFIFFSLPKEEWVY